MSVFPDTARFREAVGIINGVDSAKLPRLLTRVISKVDGKSERIFSESEEVQLGGMLGLSLAQVNTLVEGSCFIFEKAAFHNHSPAKLATEMTSAGFTEEATEGFCVVWKDQRAEVLGRLREYVVTAPRTLRSLDWSLNLQMSQDSLCRLRLPTAIMEFHVTDHTYPDQPTEETVGVEMGYDGLYGLFTQLETIQQQLDALR